MRRTKASRRRWPKKAAVTVLSPAILTPLVSAGLLASPAGASSQDVSFDIGGGTSCTMRITRQYPFEGDAQVGRGTTTLIGGTGPNASECTSSSNFVFVYGEWNDPFGDFVTAGNLGGTSVAAKFAPIGSNFKTGHEAFIGGSCDCFSPFFTLTK